MAISGGDGSIILTTKVDDQGLKQGTQNMRSEAAKLAAEYRKAGLSQSEAMKKAWSEIERTKKQTDKATRSTKEYGKQSEKTAKKATTAFGKISTALKAVGTAFSIYKLVQFGKEAINLASDLQEVQNVVDVAFGEMSYKIEKFADTAIENFGISKLTAKRTASTYMAMAKGMGIADEAASDMAITMTGLTADIASFYNMSQERADVILKSVYTGETETLKQLGIVMTEVNLENFAMSKGITKNIRDMTQQEKTMLRYQFVLEQTALAQGDFVRTQDSWANQTRVLQERWKEMQTTFGDAFIVLGQLVLPVVNAVVKGLTGIANITKVAFTNLAALFGKEIATGEEKTNQTAQNIEQQTENQKELNKAVKKGIAEFDEINQLAEKTASSQEESANLSQNIDVSNGDGDISSTVGEINGTLALIMGVVGGAMIAIGLILLFTGNIAWGIGFIIFGGVLAGTAAGAFSGTNIDQETIEKIGSITKIVGISMIAIGLLLLFLGQIPWGIGFIVGGAVIYGVSESAIGETDADTSTKDRIGKILDITGKTFIAIGLLLLFLGQVPWGIGFIVGGAVIYGVSESAIGETDADTSTKDRIGKILDITGKTFIAIGLLLLFLGQVPWGLGFIAAGAGLESVSEMFPTTTSEDVKSNCDAILSFLAGLTAYLVAQALLKNWATFVKLWKDFRALMQLIHTEGFFKTITGLFGSSLGTMQLWAIAIGVVVGSIAYLALNWDKLAPAQRVITILSALAAAATAAAVAIALFHTSWSVGIAAAAIAGGIALLAGTYLFKNANGKKSLSGGGTAPADISQYAYLAEGGTYNLPHLAQGAVIPPNREFLAVLGDQKQGTNIETPESLLREIYAEGNAETNALLQQLIQVMQKGMTVNVDGKQLMRINREAETRVGRQTVTGGFANAY